MGDATVGFGTSWIGAKCLPLGGFGCMRTDVPDAGNHARVPRLAYVVYVTRVVGFLVLNSSVERDDVCFDTGSHSEVQVKGRETN